MIRIGTRGSALALAQAEWVAQRVAGETEIVAVRASGDRGVAVGDKSRWVSELERALLEDRIDLAVHSAKDVPAVLPDGLSIVGVPERADARDALCGAPSLDALEEGAAVGTSSLRRRAQLLALRPDLRVEELRGNVDGPYPMGEVQVYVAEDDVDDARELLLADEVESAFDTDDREEPDDRPAYELWIVVAAMVLVAALVLARGV